MVCLTVLLMMMPRMSLFVFRGHVTGGWQIVVREGWLGRNARFLKA